MPYLGLESVRHGNSRACIQDIMRLHFPEAEDVADLTYGKGRFWTSADPPCIIGLDADPRGGAMIQSDYRHVPLRDQCMDIAIFDPPFIFTSGLRRIVGSKRFFLGSDENVRFNLDERVLRPRGPEDLLNHTQTAANEARRIARHGMVLKGQDLIVNKPNWWSFDVMRMLNNIGFGMPADMLTQVSPAARLRDPRWQNQYHFRRAHAIYLIYKWEGG